MQFNTNGILNSRHQIVHLLEQRNILVACIQETKLTSSSNLPAFPNFATVRRDRPTGGGGGLITLVHHSVAFTEVNTNHLFPGDSTAEHLAIEVDIDGAKLLVVNVYIPPISSCPTGYTPNFTHLFSSTDDTLVVGDFNAHDARWHSATQDHGAAERGVAICDALDASNLTCINGDSPTRMPRNGPLSSPDLAFTSVHLALNAEWEPLVALNSDHLPIIIDLDGWFSAPPPQTGPATFTNFKKADWARFTDETERHFIQEQPPCSPEQGEKVIRRILLRASARNIPSGRILNFTPGLTPETLHLIRQRDELRTLNSSDPHIAQLDQEIDTRINANLEGIWRREVESFSLRRKIGKMWRTIQRLSGKRSLKDPNQPITFDGVSISNKKDIANKFVKQFTRPTSHRQNPESRRTIRQIHSRNPLDHNRMPFTVNQVKVAIQKSGNSTAPSPDGLTVLHLKHLGPLGLRYLCRVFNISYAHARIPDIWKHAIITPLLKPGKPKGQGSSHRPISLLCPASKVLERLMLPLIEPYIHLDDSQHGFRKGRSTTTALLPLTHQIVRGFNQHLPPWRTVAMAVDFSKAFDTVDHNALLRCLLHCGMEANTMRWICAYLRGRTASCRYNGTDSSKILIRQGVPQGSVLSPMLFNAYVASYPHTADLCTSYADDFTASASHPDVEQATATMASHAQDVASWAAERELQISTQKSTVTLFTSQRQQYRFHPVVPLNDTPLPLDQSPKILGVTFDPLLFFHKHAEDLVEGAKRKFPILKALTGTDWGQHKETLIATYKAIIDSTFSYAAPIWVPNASPSSVASLQTIQNSALRLATGCHLSSAVDHLHAEAMVLKVQEHLDMLCTQFLATSLQREHPSFATVTASSGPRRMKHTLQSRYLPKLEELTGEAGLAGDGTITDPIAARKQIHTRAVESSISARQANRVLDAPAPDVSYREEELPRKTRRTLAQLRSGESISLNSYKHKIGLADSPLCPCCRSEEHTTEHIFRCPSHATSYSPIDLWRHPVEVADYLRTLPFMDLPEGRRPPPEPPPNQETDT